MPRPRSIRDPIHGFVELDEAEWAIVNAPAFQRLRDVHQLGMGHMVYPGANHSRFEHSLGCLHVATRMLERLVADPESRDRWLGILGARADDRHAELRRVVRMAALLHDVGHAPFSHAGEDLFVPEHIELGNLSDAERMKLQKEYSHEHSTVALIRDRGICRILESAGINPTEVVWVATEPQRAGAKDLFQHPELDLLNQLLAGELGADRCDYLLRDAYHSGQPAGAFDLERLIQQTTIVEHEGADYLGLKEGGAIAAEQMVAGRYAAYVNLYFHKAKRAYEHHLVRFLKDWLPKGRLPGTPSGFIELSDSVVWAAILKAGADSKSMGHRDAKALAARGHYRAIFERVPADKRPHPGEEGAGSVRPEVIAKFEQNVREKYGHEAFVDVCSHSATKLRQRQHRIMVKLKDRVLALDNLSEIVKGMEDRIWRLRVHASDGARAEIEQYCGNLWKRLVQDGASE